MINVFIVLSYMYGGKSMSPTTFETNGDIIKSALFGLGYFTSITAHSPPGFSCILRRKENYEY